MKTIFITGASSGIGKACVGLFSRKGWNIVATMRKPYREPQWKDNIIVLKLDVTKKKTIVDAVKSAKKRFGRIDVLLNNAGYSQVGAIESMSEKQMRDVFETNVFGLMNVTNAILPDMRERNKGMIINVSSVVGKITSPLSGYYCATKHAVESISESLWHELSQTRICVKVIEPGFTTTRFHTTSLVRGEVKIPMYEPKIEKKLERMKHLSNASTAEEVASVIYTAATGRSRKLRYPAGRRAKVQLLMRSILPDSIFLRMVNRKFAR